MIDVERLTELYNKRFKISPNDYDFIQQAYREALGRSMKKTCQNAYQDAVIQTMLHYRSANNTEMKEKSNYTLKNGVVLQNPVLNGVYTNSSLTDEVAELYLKNFPQKINLFASFPNDWEERIEKQEPEITEAEKPEGKSELTDEEHNLILEIAGHITTGTSKAKIKELYKGYEIGGKPVTVRKLDEYIKQAEQLK